jgi:hypothetical protein
MLYRNSYLFLRADTLILGIDFNNLSLRITHPYETTAAFQYVS